MSEVELQLAREELQKMETVAKKHGPGESNVRIQDGRLRSVQMTPDKTIMSVFETDVSVSGEIEMGVFWEKFGDWISKVNSDEITLKISESGVTATTEKSQFSGFGINPESVSQPDIFRFEDPEKKEDLTDYHAFVDLGAFESSLSLAGIQSKAVYLRLGQEMEMIGSADSVESKTTFVSEGVERHDPESVTGFSTELLESVLYPLGSEGEVRLSHHGPLITETGSVFAVLAPRQPSGGEFPIE